jgi:hypothetical protein
MVALSSPQLALHSLTVPVERLPPGCRLVPARTSGTGQPAIIMYPSLTDNPWVGTDRLKTRRIREVIDGPPYAADAEALSKLSDGVLEAYRAVYQAASERVQINVYAVRFNDPKLTARAFVTQLAGGRIIVRGSTVVRVLSAADGGCLRRISDYIASLQGLGSSR